MVHASVIGCGNMGSALIEGLSRSDEHVVTACDVDPQALEAVSEYCAETTSDLSRAADAEVVFVVVKPDVVPEVVERLDLAPDQTLVSIAAGVPTAVIEPLTDATVVRVMPNLAAATGTMAAAVSGEEVGEDVAELLDAVGVFVEVEEELMDVATAVNGSGPAFVFYLIDAMKQAGIDAGLDPEDAEVLAAQTFKGAAETIRTSEESIDEMIEAVCSPKGTTIEGMAVLRDSDVQETIGDAVDAAHRRAVELAEESADE